MMPKRKATQTQEFVTIGDVERARRKLAADSVSFWKAVQTLDEFEPSEDMLRQAEHIVRQGVRNPDDFEPSQELKLALNSLATTIARAYAARSKLIHERALLSQSDFERARAKAIGLVNADLIRAVERVAQARQADAQRLGGELVRAVRSKIEGLRSSVAQEIWDLYLALERRGAPNTSRQTRLECAAALSLIPNWPDRLLRGEDSFVFLADSITDGAASKMLKQRQELDRAATTNWLGQGFWAQLS